MVSVLPVDSFVPANGLQLHYRRWQASALQPALPPIFFLHGLASSSYIWNLVAPRLAEQGHDVIALDQRGHGESAKPDDGYEFASILADDQAVLNALELHRPVVIGHSWGAMAALELAVAPGNDVSALVLVDGAAQQLSRRPGWSREQALVDLAPPRYGGVTRETFLSYFANSPLAPFWTPEIEASVLNLVEEHPDGTIWPRLTYERHLQIVAAMWDQPTLELYARVQCPLKLVLAERKPVTDADTERVALRNRGLDEIRATRPEAQIVLMPDTIHDIPLQRPEEVAHEILALIPAAVALRAK